MECPWEFTQRFIIRMITTGTVIERPGLDNPLITVIKIFQTSQIMLNPRMDAYLAVVIFKFD